MGRARFLAVFALAGLSALACGSRHVRLNPTNIVPAAQGRATLGLNANGETTVDLELTHLTPPGRLSPPCRAYVVWIETDDEPALRKGELRVADDWRAQLSFVAPARSFDIFITAENTALGDAPRGPELLRASVNAK